MGGSRNVCVACIDGKFQIDSRDVIHLPGYNEYPHKKDDNDGLYCYYDRTVDELTDLLSTKGVILPLISSSSEEEDIEEKGDTPVKELRKPILLTSTDIFPVDGKLGICDNEFCAVLINYEKIRNYSDNTLSDIVATIPCPLYYIDYKKYPEMGQWMRADIRVSNFDYFIIILFDEGIEIARRIYHELSDKEDTIEYILRNIKTIEYNQKYIPKELLYSISYSDFELSKNENSKRFIFKRKMPSHRVELVYVKTEDKTKNKIAKLGLRRFYDAVKKMENIDTTQLRLYKLDATMTQNRCVPEWRKKVFGNVDDCVWMFFDGVNIFSVEELLERIPSIQSQ